MREEAFAAAFFGDFLTAVFLSGAFFDAVRFVATFRVVLLTGADLFADPATKRLAVLRPTVLRAAAFVDAFRGPALAIFRAIALYRADGFFPAGFFAAAFLPVADFLTTAAELLSDFFGVGSFFAELDIDFLRAVMFHLPRSGTR